MRTTIDRAGRIVIPKPIRERSGLRHPQEVEVETAPDGAITIRRPARRIGLVRDEDGFLHADPEATKDLPQVTPEDVRDVLERTRR
jgi:AbrB family looped-hinge helix DNA binding protein